MCLPSNPWQSLLHPLQLFIQSVMAHFDLNKSGHIDIDELSSMLVELNGGGVCPYFGGNCLLTWNIWPYPLQSLSAIAKSRT